MTTLTPSTSTANIVLDELAAPDLFPPQALTGHLINDCRFPRLEEALKLLSALIVDIFDGNVQEAQEVVTRTLLQRRRKLGDYNLCLWCCRLTDQHTMCRACQRKCSGLENGPLSEKKENGQMSKFHLFKKGLLACVDIHLENVRVAKAKKVRAATTIQKRFRGFSARNHYLLDAMDAAFASLSQVRTDLRALGHLSSDDIVESHFEVAQ